MKTLWPIQNLGGKKRESPEQLIYALPSALAVKLAPSAPPKQGEQVVIVEVTGTSEVPVTFLIQLNSTLIPSQAPGSGKGSVTSG